MGQLLREKDEVAVRASQLEETAKTGDYHRKYGRMFITMEPYETEVKHKVINRKVTFSDLTIYNFSISKQFADTEVEESINDIILRAVVNHTPGSGARSPGSGLIQLLQLNTIQIFLVCHLPNCLRLASVSGRWTTMSPPTPLSPLSTISSKLLGNLLPHDYVTN